MNRKNIIIGCVVIVLIVLGIFLNKNKTVESIPNDNKDLNQVSNYQIAIDIKGEVKILDYILLMVIVELLML